MGNKDSVSETKITNQFHWNKFRTLPSTIQPQKQPQLTTSDCISIEPFQALEVGDEGLDFQIGVYEQTVSITKYFDRIEDLQIYFSNAIKMSKMLQISLYDELKCSTTETPLQSTLTIDIPEYKPITFEFSKSTIEKKLDLLQFIATILSKVGNIYICPEFLALGTGGYYLLNFQETEEYTPEQIFLGFIKWIFGDINNFQICLSVEDMPQGMPIYLQQIFTYMGFLKKLSLRQVEGQLKMIKDKISFLLGKTDSLYACHFFKKTQKYQIKSDWIFFKRKHQVYFYQIKDSHSHEGKLIRKKKKINVDEVSLAFDSEQLEIMFVPENSKFIVKACQFEFESCSSISDIQIKYKLPIKFKGCLLHKTKNGEILILEHHLYRYMPSNNKLIQETKRISQYIFLTSTKESNYLIIKVSIDIFRNGIRVFYKGLDVILSHTGNQKVLQEISTIRIDLKEIIFCTEVYRGVFLMMAAKNMWIIDMNFQCFFSFATMSQIKKLAAISKGLKQTKKSEQVFEVLDQNFRVDFNVNNGGNNAVVSDNFLHIIGLVEGLPYYLKYSFVHRIGALRLEGYQPLFVLQQFKRTQFQQEQSNAQVYRFNFHEENSQNYKYRSWIFEGKLLMKVYDFKIRWEKTTYEVILSIQKIEESLKQHIEKLNENERKLSKNQMFVLLYKLFSIYEYIFSRSINHKNISINHICFTQSRQLKIMGWTEPPRNWHVSDYKDFLLTCLNVITYNSYEKISDKIITNHEKELSEFPVFNQKIQHAFKQSKMIEKKAEIEKNMQVFKSYLQKQLSLIIHNTKADKYILSFEYNTPRMSLMNTETQKLKKIVIIPEQTATEEFTFCESDKTVWNEDCSTLYIFTASYQFYELKINLDNPNEEKLILEDYEYLPNNISLSSFAYVKGKNLYSFGGIKRQQQGKLAYCNKIYKFNWKTLSWDGIADLPQSRIKPQIVISICQRYVFLFGGDKEQQFEGIKIIKFDTATNECTVEVDKSSTSIISSINADLPLKIFHLNEQLALFLFWYIEQSDYVLRYVSFTAIGFDFEIRGKNFVFENAICRESVTLDENCIHILRPYGKYCKLTVHKLQNVTIKNQTIYAI